MEPATVGGHILGHRGLFRDVVSCQLVHNNFWTVFINIISLPASGVSSARMSTARAAPTLATIGAEEVPRNHHRIREFKDSKTCRPVTCLAVDEQDKVS